MYKKVLKVAFVAAIAMVAGINVYNAQKTKVLSDVAMANVEALANNEGWLSDCSVYCQEDSRYTCIIIWEGDNVQNTTCNDHRKKQS